jgi:hypothetical protein
LQREFKVHHSVLEIKNKNIGNPERDSCGTLVLKLSGTHVPESQAKTGRMCREKKFPVRCAATL